ncbi:MULTISPECIES: hypothetical protein [Sphingomonas]|nr:MULTISPECIES: hypothetical protein [Sphingomonas]MBB4047678.1 hypothetical protein [Sphingomonas zeae]NUU47653.1 hypothetical protein [Sphingomonas zeae]
MTMIDGHAVNERFRLITHQHYADRIAADPGIVNAANDLVSSRLADGSITLADRMWGVLLTMSVDEIRSAMLKDDPDGRLLRSGSPFSELLGEQDQGARSRLWNRARAELAASRT